METFSATWTQEFDDIGEEGTEDEVLPIFYLSEATQIGTQQFPSENDPLNLHKVSSSSSHSTAGVANANEQIISESEPPEIMRLRAELARLTAQLALLKKRYSMEKIGGIKKYEQLIKTLIFANRIAIEQITEYMTDRPLGDYQKSMLTIEESLDQLAKYMEKHEEQEFNMTQAVYDQGVLNCGQVLKHLMKLGRSIKLSVWRKLWNKVGKGQQNQA